MDAAVQDPSLESNERHFARAINSLNGQQAKVVKKIAILGRAPSSLHLAPYDDTEWEIWSLGNAAAKPGDTGLQKGPSNIPRWDAWFELHDLEYKKVNSLWNPEYWDWLATDHGKPIYIAAPSPLIPHGTVYPWDKVFERFGRYFNNSISEMIALALLQGATHLSLYGVDMAQSDPAMHAGNPEYQHQRPSCEYLLGIAHEICRARGGSVYVPPESDLLKCARIYAYQSDHSSNRLKVIARHKELSLRRAEMLQKATMHKEQKRAWERLLAKAEGALEVLAADDPRRAEQQQKMEQAGEQVRAHDNLYTQFDRAVNKFDGAIEDNDYWLQRI